MLKRKASSDILYWKEHKTTQALLVDGARQVGKTYIIREFAKEHYEHFAEINFLENERAAEAVSNAGNADELFVRISAFAEGELVPGKTLVFLDEVQECKKIATAIKFLVDKFPEYDYVLSGSLLGVELKNIKSVPVGYLDSLTMYPLDFEEYCRACGLPANVIAAAESSFKDKVPVDGYIHERLLALFHEYLIVGGMPAAVQKFVEGKNITAVRNIHKNIIARYREDITKYAKKRSRAIKAIYDLMPAELSRQSKRFIVSDINKNAHFDRYENDFLWLADAGVALPVYNVGEPRPPLAISLNPSFFKLFLSDVGLLTYLCGMDATRDVLAGRTDIHYGALYENFAAQELVAHGFPSYYFKSKTLGELDFVVEHPKSTVVPLEIKSGKTYTRHSALNKVLGIENYGIQEALVFCEGNISRMDNILYAPIYCLMFLENKS